MKTGDTLETITVIRAQKTGVLLPRRGTFVRDIENLGRKLILVNFGPAGVEYLFPHEVLAEPQRLNEKNYCPFNACIPVRRLEAKNENSRTVLMDGAFIGSASISTTT